MRSDEPGASLALLSLSTVFPNPQHLAAGLFIRERLVHMGELADVKVVAPVLLLDYANLRGSEGPQIPPSAQTGAVEVFYRRWLYIPGTGALTALLLALQLLPFARGLRRRWAFQAIDAHFAYPEGVAAAVLAKFLGLPFAVTLRGSELLHRRLCPSQTGNGMVFAPCHAHLRCIPTASQMGD